MTPTQMQSRMRRSVARLIAVIIVLYGGVALVLLAAALAHGGGK